MAGTPIIDNSTNQLSLFSYNSTGWNAHKAKMINDFLILKSIKIVALQEHFLLKQNLHKIQEHFLNYELFALPAVKSNTQITRGRPSGGLAFLYSNTLSSNIERISVPNSSRVQGIKLNLNNTFYVFINVYFPVDKRNGEIDELIKVLQDIQYILDLCNDQCNIIFMGDLNADFSRDTVYVNHVKEFMLNHSLCSVWTKFNCDFSYSHTRNVNGTDTTYYSTIDHFCVNSTFLSDCIEAFPLHSPDNISNHEPIFLKINCLENIIGGVPNISSQNIGHSKPLWDSATPSDLEEFVNHLEQLVYNIDIPAEALNCTDVHCNCVEHRRELDLYATKLMQAISTAVHQNIPHSNPSSAPRASVPGWNEFVKPFREDSLFWHSVWISAGRPQNTELHKIMKNTRNKYHYAIRLVKKEDSEIRKNNFLEKCLNGKINDILKHIKSSRKNKSGLAKNMDGVSGSENIASHFKNIYEGIYNQHKSTDKVHEILLNLNSCIVDQDRVELNKISETLIVDIISNLHSNKSDSSHNWSTDALKIGVNVLASHFSNLFRAFFSHGYVSELFLDCSLIPIVKDQNSSKTKSDNYRLIAISSLFLKIMDYIVLTLYSDVFKSFNLQFGFQKNCSTTMCTWTLLETVNYFTNRGSSMYVCLLDLSKAFDTIKHDILFKKLSEKIPPLFLRVIIFSYLYQKCTVQWGNAVSGDFHVSNGVRQGAVASPTFFNVYLEDLFSILKDSGLGCMIDSFYYGFLGYADDCALLSPSRDPLQKMLNICEKYFTEHGIKISTNVILEKSKTKCFAINISAEPVNIKLYDLPLPWVDSYKHLGHLIHRDESMSHDLLKKEVNLSATYTR